MAVRIQKRPSADDLEGVKIGLKVPFIITIACASLEMLSKSRFSMVPCEGVNEIAIWIVETLISYFFPSLLSMVVALLAQSFVIDNIGFRYGARKKAVIATGFYLFFYIVYLMYVGTWYDYLFVALNILYVVYIVKKCLDISLFLNGNSRPSDKITNSPV